MLLAQLSIPWLCGGVAFALYIFHKYQQYARLSAFPGPPTVGWSHILQVRHMLSGRRETFYDQVNKRYGPIARVSPNDLLTDSPELIHRINSVRAGYTRTKWFYGSTRLVPGEDHCFSELDESKHNKRRAQMAAGYSGKDNVNLETDIDVVVQDLLDLIRRKYISTGDRTARMDLGRILQYFTLDVITKLGFGKSFGDLKSDKDVHGYLKCSEDSFFTVSANVAFGLLPILHWKPIYRLMGPSETDKGGMGSQMGIFRGMVNERLQKPLEGRSDMAASFIHNGLTSHDLFVESFIQMTGGSDTSSTALRCMMLYVISNPRVYRKLQAECDAHVPPPGAIASEAMLKTLPYLRAVVREGMRIHPPAALEAPKTVPPGGDTIIIDGKSYYLPGGTNIVNNSWGIHRQRSIFGDDADAFRPERWLPKPGADPAAEEARLIAMQRVSELNFGHGKYQCLGKSIAWMEMNKVVFELMRGFDFALWKPEDGMEERNYNGIFRLVGGLDVVVTERA